MRGKAPAAWLGLFCVLFYRGSPRQFWGMKALMIPRSTSIMETLEGKKVRIVSWDQKTNKVKVKCLKTGLPFTVMSPYLRPVK